MQEEIFDDSNEEVVWEPQPGPQTSFVTCPVFEVLYGGARGGGKTDAFLGEFAIHANTYGEGAIGLAVRRERTQLVEAIERSRQIYKPLGAKFETQDKQWRFPNGARLRFAYLENDSDADNYQGHSYSRVYAEEVGTFPNARPIMKLMATLRSGTAVPVGFRATGNPGGPGHQWVKARYIDPAPLGNVIHRFIYHDPFTGKEVFRDRIFIPSKVKDNKFLGADYVANLQMSGPPQLVRAWLDGDWNVVQGAYFEEFTSRHIVEPVQLPRHWTRFRAMDWGSARPFCILWFAVADGTYSPPGQKWERGALIVYREWYGASSPNQGVKLPAGEVAKGIIERETFDVITYGIADPATKQSDGGPSILERLCRAGANFRAGDNKRIPGWDEIRARLRGSMDGNPMLFIFSTCQNLIRTLPALQHDERKPEDLDTDAEDHAADALRYGCMSRPFARREASRQAPEFLGFEMPIDKIIDLSEKRMAMRSKL